ncbi:MAG: hypothetical protein RLZZ501_904 [Pseudomonadota bacterium]
MSSVALPVVDGDDGLAKYLRDIRAFPLLEAEEEFMLARRLIDYGDTEAAQRLVTSHLRLVAKIAIGYRHYGLPVADLISEGNIGLMRAVKKFDPDRGFRLATYAMWWIKASLNEFVLNSWSLVKIGTLAAQRSCSSTCAGSSRACACSKPAISPPSMSRRSPRNFRSRKATWWR